MVDFKTIKGLYNCSVLQGQIFTNGVFDLIHAGHIYVLKECAKYAHTNDLKIVVGINDDKSVKELKGPHRPIFLMKDRVEILSSIRYIDYIVTFNTKSVLPVIEFLKPKFLIKGGDYTITTDTEERKVVGQSFVESYGGEVITTDLHGTVSTTSIIEKIKRLNG